MVFTIPKWSMAEDTVKTAESLGTSLLKHLITNPENNTWENELTKSLGTISGMKRLIFFLRVGIVPARIHVMFSVHFSSAKGEELKALCNASSHVRNSKQQLPNKI
jgi:hypothetical protein